MFIYFCGRALVSVDAFLYEDWLEGGVAEDDPGAEEAVYDGEEDLDYRRRIELVHQNNNCVIACQIPTLHTYTFPSGHFICRFNLGYSSWMSVFFDRIDASSVDRA